MFNCYRCGRELLLPGLCIPCTEEQQRQERAAKAVEDQAQLQRDMLYQQEQEAYRRREADEAMLDMHREKLRVERMRHEEDSQRHEAEEIRQKLRYGLPEFSEEFQEKWAAVYARREQVLVGQRATEMRTNLLAGRVDDLEKSINKTIEPILAEQAEQFNSKWRDPSFHMDLSKENALTLLKQSSAELNRNFAAIMQHSQVPSLFEKAGILARAKHPITSYASLLRSLCEVGYVLQNFGILGGLPNWLNVPIAIFLILFGVAAPLGIYALLLSMSDNLADSTALQYIFTACSLVGAIAVPALFFALLEKWRKTTVLDNIEEDCSAFVLSAHKLLSSIPLDRVPRSFAPNLSPEEQRVILREALLKGLLVDYTVLHAEESPSGAKRLDLQKKKEQFEKDIEQANAEFQRQFPDTVEILKQFDYLQSEILRVGTQIINGVRVQGKRISVLACPSCGGPVGSESKQCPYCAAALYFGPPALP